MRASLQGWNLKITLRRSGKTGLSPFALLAAFFLAICAILAQDQDPTLLSTPAVLRVGDKLACRCQTCRNTVGNCPMLHCGYTEPMRQRIKKMQDAGIADNNIINSIVQEQGVVALASPPATGWGFFTWVMPAVALVIGFLIYSWWVRRNRQQEPEKISEYDRAVLDRFRDQIESELGESNDIPRGGRSGTK
ncbi:MAG: cytochrome c-type biogenesis protein CcmH [Bryobacteraceae bacterium]